MKRVTAGLAVIVLLAGGFYVLMSRLVSSDRARTEVVNALSRWSGSPVALGDRVELSLLPGPRVTLYDLRISDPDAKRPGDILTADMVDAEIRILPLLIGTVGFKSLEITNPKINFIQMPGGRRDLRFDGSSAAVQLALTGGPPVERLALKNGMIEIQDVAGRTTDMIGLPGLVLDWTGLREPALLSGSIARNNGTLSFDVRVADPLSFFERQSTAFSMTLDGAFINATMEGSLADYKAPEFTGNLTASGPSLRDLISTAGGEAPEGPGLGAFSVGGNAQISPDSLFVDQGQVELDGNIATGSIQLDLEKGAKLAGTLAFQSLDLTPYLALLGGSGSQHWTDRVIKTGWFRDLDADLRLSADRIVAGPYELGGTAASVYLSERQLQIGVAESAFYGGTINGTISVTDLPRRTGQKVALQLRASGFDLASAVTQAGLAQQASGKATMTVDLATEGADLGEQFDNSRGSFSVRSTSGRIPDLGIAFAWQARSQGSGLSGVARGSASDYEKLEIDGTIGNRAIVIDRVLLESGPYAASLQGTLRLADQHVALEGRLAGKGQLTDGTPLTIGGPVTDPRIEMEPARAPAEKVQGN